MSEQIVIRVDGEEAKRILARLQSGGFLRGAMQDVARQAQANIKKYPAQRPGTSYRRTGTLGRRWTYRVTMSLYSATAVLGNNTPYGPYVQSEAEQAEVHQGWGWPTDESELEAAKEYAPVIINDAIEIELRQAKK